MDELLSILLLASVTLIGGSILYHYARTGVPPVPSAEGEIAAVIALLEHANLPQGARIYELGSGFGGLAIALARRFPNARVVGIERSPFPHWASRVRARRIPNLELILGDFYDLPLADAAAITAYLMIGPMPRLAGHLDRALPPGTPVVALGFWFRDRTPERSAGPAALYSWPGRRPSLSAGKEPGP